MSGPRPPRLASAHAADARTPPGSAAPASLVAPAAHWLSAAALRAAVGAWAYGEAPAQERPTAGAVRTAIGVAAALLEQRRTATLHAAHPAAAAGGAAAEDVADLAERSGYGGRDVSAALTLLAAVRAVSRRSGAGGATVALDPTLLVPAPVASALRWDDVRARLRAVGGSLPAALAVVRELATAAGALGDADGDGPTVRASVRDLEERTAFGRSAVAEALGALERAGLVGVETRAGRTTRFVLRPAAFGRAQADAPLAPPLAPPLARPTSPSRPPSAAAAGGAPEPVAAPGGPPAATAVAPAAPPALPAGAGAPVLVGDFAGTPIHAPPGTPLVVECDAEGRWYCRVGPFLRLGPIDGTGRR